MRRTYPLIQLAPQAKLPVEDRAVFVRKAEMADVGAMLGLINSYASEGIMLPRTEFEMAENLRDFSVVYSEKNLIGCGALHFYTPESAEIRSLAVHPEKKTLGIGTWVVEALEHEARKYGLRTVFAFTYVPRFFFRLGYHEVDRGELPLKVWKDCLRCPKFNCCDEIAVQKALEIPSD